MSTLLSGLLAHNSDLLGQNTPVGEPQLVHLPGSSPGLMSPIVVESFPRMPPSFVRHLFCFFVWSEAQSRKLPSLDLYYCTSFRRRGLQNQENWGPEKEQVGCGGPVAANGSQPAILRGGEQSEVARERGCGVPQMSQETQCQQADPSR
jgi:hypothetical protein